MTWTPGKLAPPVDECRCSPFISNIGLGSPMNQFGGSTFWMVGDCARLADTNSNIEIQRVTPARALLILGFPEAAMTAGFACLAALRGRCRRECVRAESCLAATRRAEPFS